METNEQKESILSFDSIKKTMQQNNNTIWILISSVIIILVTICSLIWLQTVRDGKEAAQSAYEKTKKTVEDKVYKDIYQDSYKKAEEKHHVANRVNISLDSMDETAQLEVLKVSDIEYTIYEEKDGIPVIKWVKDAVTGSVSSWIAVPGSGVFTVNLKAGEYIIDNDRRYVLVRVPEPEMTQFTIDYDKVDILEVSDKGLIPSAKRGEQHIKEQLEKAYLMIRQKMMSNQKFYESAQKSAENVIEALVKELNPDIPDLVVDVEFIR